MDLFILLGSDYTFHTFFVWNERRMCYWEALGLTPKTFIVRKSRIQFISGKARFREMDPSLQKLHMCLSGSAGSRLKWTVPSLEIETCREALFSGFTVVRLSFIGESANEPIIAGLIRRFNIDVNILFGNIDHLKNTPFGTLTIELSGEDGAIQAALNYLNAKELGIEVIGYVARNARAAG